MKNAKFSDLVTCLCGEQRPRVWSLLVTVFGELAQDEGARISGAMLRHLSDLIGLKPEAVRVALHRLRKDDWIESHRQGRNSEYTLTDWGRTQCVEATPRIYANCAMVDHVSLVVLEPGQTMPFAKSEGVYLSSNLFLTSQPAATEEAYIAPVNATMPLPDWMTNKLHDEEISKEASLFAAALDQFDTLASSITMLDPRERAVLRILIVHGWRRIALKTPVLPDFIYPDAWPVKICRQKVFDVLQKIPSPKIHELEEKVVYVNGVPERSITPVSNSLAPVKGATK